MRLSLSRGKLLGIYFLLALLSVCFTKPLGGDGAKLAFANVAQIGLVIYAFFRYRLPVEDYLIILFITCSMTLSGLYAHLVLGVTPKVFVYLYFVTSLVFFAQFHRILSKSDESIRSFVVAARISLALLLPVYALLATYQFLEQGVMGVSYGADDKSHAAIFMAFQAFLALAVFSRAGYVIAGALLLLSALTISRLPYVFAPFLILAMLVKVHRESDSPSKLMASYSVFLLIILGGVFFVSQNIEFFDSLQRVSSIFDHDAEPNASTEAHHWLIRLGYEIKMQSIGNLMLGVSPGSFGEALISSGLNYSELEAADPQFIEFARLAKAPIHSAHLALFAEFPIWIFVLYVMSNILIVRQLFKRRDWNLLLFFMPFSIFAIYYSVHNKAYYFLVLALLSVNYGRGRPLMAHDNS